MNKKLILILTSFILVISLVACQNTTSKIEEPVIQEELTEDDALKVALTHAGVSKEDPDFKLTSLENDKGEYSLVFEDKDQIYDYKIDSSTGKIINSSSLSNTTDIIKSTDKDSGKDSNKTGDKISSDQAIKIALEDSQIDDKSKVNFIKTELDHDDNKTKYEIEFIYNNKEYDYDIDAYTGEIISFDKDIESSTKNTVSTKDIGEARAKEIALNKVSGANNNHIKIEKDYDDGRLIYEGEIIFDGIEYEFEIDGQSGNIIEWSKESIYD